MAGRRWRERIADVGSALLDVWRAELASLAEELRASGRNLKGGVVLLCLSGALLFWTLGLLVWTVLALLETWLEEWQAGLVLFAVLAVATLCSFLAARARLRRAENPVAMVRRRGREHGEWVQRNLLGGGEGDTDSDGPEA